MEAGRILESLSGAARIGLDAIGSSQRGTLQFGLYPDGGC